jgi:serine phosphatase RsbU (regulator of sigma subunit)
MCRVELLLMHRTLKEMPGPHAEMHALAARWDLATFRLELVNCGHVPPIVIRANHEPEIITLPPGRATPKPSEHTTTLEPGERPLMFSDGVAKEGEGQAGLGLHGVIAAALVSERGGAADTVRKIHTAVLESCDSELGDDATVVCLAAE